MANNENLDKKNNRKFLHEMVDYVCEYHETIASRKVFPDVEPGYLRPLMPETAPQKPESWSDIMADVEKLIMPGITHWHHPNFFAYFPAAFSFPALCGDILSGGIGCIGFSWAASPACTELEVVMMDWLAELIQLPDRFRAGGIIQSSASDSCLISSFGARSKAIGEYRSLHPDSTVYEAMSKLVAYCSDQAHCSVERACLLGMIELRKIPTDSQRRMRGDALREVIEEDIAKGRIPFFCVATLGTTSSCAFDSLEEIGPLCEGFNIWLHVDAAYAGSAFICPEYRHFMNGVEYAMSYNFNATKWFLVNFDCSCLWYRNVKYVEDSFNVDPLYLKHKNQGKVPDFRHWQIPLGRRFRSLKLWFVLRLYGVEGLQEYIRNHIRLAKYFEELIIKEGRLEIVEEVTMGLVCFRPKNCTNSCVTKLYDLIESDGRLHLTMSDFHEDGEIMCFLRLSVNYQYATKENIDFAFSVIMQNMDKL